MFNAKEYKLMCLRETPNPETLALCDCAEKASLFWDLNIKTGPYYNPEVETFWVLFLNARRKVKGCYLVATGTMDTVMVHAREVFRPAILGAAHSIVLMHNHPSGDPTPSEADIKVTRDLIRAGQILKIDVCDHIIKGFEKFCSLRELGYFYTV